MHQKNVPAIASSNEFYLHLILLPKFENEIPTFCVTFNIANKFSKKYVPAMACLPFETVRMSLK